MEKHSSNGQLSLVNKKTMRQLKKRFGMSRKSEAFSMKNLDLEQETLVIFLLMDSYAFKAISCLKMKTRRNFSNTSSSQSVQTNSLAIQTLEDQSFQTLTSTTKQNKKSQSQNTKYTLNQRTLLVLKTFGESLSRAITKK